MPKMLFDNGTGWGTFRTTDTENHPFIMPFSGITNAPRDILEEAVNALTENKPFEITFDAEDKGEWSIISYGEHTIATVESNTRCGYTKTRLALDKEILIQTLISDIEADIDNWAKFALDLYDENECLKEKQELTELMRKIKKLLKNKKG